MCKDQWPCNDLSSSCQLLFTSAEMIETNSTTPMSNTGDMGSLNLKWRLSPDRPYCGGVNQHWFWTIQEYISYLLSHAQSFKSEIRRPGLCLEGNSGDLMERHIAEHCIERNENFKKQNGALRVGENDYNANGDKTSWNHERYDIFEELPSEREEIPTWPNPAWQVLGFRRQKFVGEY